MPWNVLEDACIPCPRRDLFPEVLVLAGACRSGRVPASREPWRDLEFVDVKSSSAIERASRDEAEV